MEEAIKLFFKRLFCKHISSIAEEFVLEGTDKVVLRGYRCHKCGKETYRSAR